MSFVDFWLNQVKSTQGSASAREFPIRGNDDHFTKGAHGTRQDMQTNRVNTVIICQQNTHTYIVADGSEPSSILGVTLCLTSSEMWRSSLQERSHSLAMIFTLETRRHRCGVSLHMLGD